MASEQRSQTQGVMGNVTKALNDLYCGITNNNAMSPWEKIISKVEKTVHLRRDQIAYVIIGVLAVYFCLVSADRVIYTIFGIVYPLVKTVKEFGGEQREQEKWLAFWSTFAAVSVFDLFFIPLFGMFYYLAKTAFLLYLYVPQTEGAIGIFHGIVKPTITFLEQSVLELVSHYKSQ